MDPNNSSICDICIICLYNIRGHIKHHLLQVIEKLLLTYCKNKQDVQVLDFIVYVTSSNYRFAVMAELFVK